MAAKAKAAATPSMDVAVDVSAANRELVRLAVLTGKDLGEVMRDEAKLLTGTLIDYTPPFKAFGKKAGAKGAGDRRIKAEMSSLFLPVEDMAITKNPRNERLGDRVSKLVRARDRDALAVVLPKAGVPIDDPALILPGDYSLPEIKERARSETTGRVRKRPKRRLVRRPGKSRVQRAALAKVGLGKSGWFAAAQHFGVKVAAFISRHGARYGSVRDRTENENPSVTITNRVPYMTEQDADLRILSRALRTRAGKLRRRVEFLVKSNAGKSEARANRRR